jgi:hypothetical protein
MEHEQRWRRWQATVRIGSLVAALAWGNIVYAQSSTEAADDDEIQVRIDSPTEGQRVSGRGDIRGRAMTADPAKFDYYRIYVGRGIASAHLRPLAAPVTEPVEDGILGTVDLTNVPPGDGTVVLRVFDKDGGTREVNVNVIVEASVVSAPPQTTGPVVIVPPPQNQTDLPATAPPVQGNPVVTDLPSFTPSSPGFVPSSTTTGPVSPITPLSPALTDALPSDPLQDDPITDDIQVLPPIPAPIPLVPIPNL